MYAGPRLQFMVKANMETEAENRRAEAKTFMQGESIKNEV